MHITFSNGLQTMLELLFGAGLVVMFLKQDKLCEWEERKLRAIKERRVRHEQIDISQ